MAFNWQKIFSTWAWHNKSVARDTPLSAANLQKLNDAIDTLDDRVVAAGAKLDEGGSGVPTDHSSTATTYGVGSTTKYGHVKTVTGDMNGASHADGEACSKNHTHGQYSEKTATETITGTKYYSNPVYFGNYNLTEHTSVSDSGLSSIGRSCQILVNDILDTVSAVTRKLTLKVSTAAAATNVSPLVEILSQSGANTNASVNIKAESYGSIEDVIITALNKTSEKYGRVRVADDGVYLAAEYSVDTYAFLTVYKPSLEDGVVVAQPRFKVETLSDEDPIVEIYNGGSGNTAVAGTIKLHGISTGNDPLHEFVKLWADYNGVFHVDNDTDFAENVTFEGNLYAYDEDDLDIYTCGDVCINKKYSSTESTYTGGNLTVAGIITVNGSDYAELFPAAEDIPKCRFVTLDGESARLAQADDGYILGVTSENPSVVGDKGVEKGIQVGLLGKLWVDHDGTAQVNGFVVSGPDGVATAADQGYRVMAVDGGRCRVLVK